MINEKQRVIPGFVPNPIRKRPKPTMFGESARQVTKTASVPIAQAINIPSLRPKLSAMYGITKNPKMAPTNSMDCRIETVFSYFGQMR